MADVKDILGIPRAGAVAGAAAAAAAKEREERENGAGNATGSAGSGRNNMGKKENGKGKGASAAALHPTSIMPQFPLGMKERRKDKSRNTFWEWRAFTSSARRDGLELHHWVKTKVHHPGMARIVSDWKEANGDYAFAKYNKKIPMVMYNDEEYNSMLNDDPEWSRDETNYLFNMCELFDLRFVIIADRYDWTGKKRSVEDLKSRYYACARRLLEAREGIEEAHKKYIEVRQPYNAQHETQRKAALDFLLTRTPTQEIEDQKLLEAAAAIESRRTVDVANVINAAQEGATPMKAGVGGSYEEREDILIAVDGSGPAPPGAYLRGAHTKARIETMLSSIPGGSKTAKLLDKAIESLGVKNLSIPTHAVCDIYVELRKETAAMMELQKEVDMRAEELAILQGRTDPVAKEKERASTESQLDPGQVAGFTKTKSAPVVKMGRAGSDGGISIIDDIKPTTAVATTAMPKSATIIAAGATTVKEITKFATPSSKDTPIQAASGAAALVSKVETPGSTRMGREKKRKAPLRYQTSPSPPRKRSLGKRK